MILNLQNEYFLTAAWALGGKPPKPTKFLDIELTGSGETAGLSYDPRSKETPEQAARRLISLITINIPSGTPAESAQEVADSKANKMVEEIASWISKTVEEAHEKI